MKKTKPKYNLLRCLGFMFRASWNSNRTVPAVVLLIAVFAAAKITSEMLLTPSILGQVERGNSLTSLFSTIGLFSLALIVFSGGRAYFDSISMPQRIDVRTYIMGQISTKSGCTSYPNLLDTYFLELQEKSFMAGNANRLPLEHIWATLQDLLTNVFGFLAYLFFVKDLHPALMLVVIATSVVSYFASRWASQWEYGHQEEENTIHKRTKYLYDLHTKREYAKDIRIFGLGSWFGDLLDRSLALYRGFLYRRERQYLLAACADLVLTVLRNGIVYFYLISLMLRQNLPIGQFLLYFGALSGFTEWVTGILKQGEMMYRESLDISRVMEFLNYSEAFNLTSGQIPCVPADGKMELRLENVSYRYPGAEKDTISHMELTVAPGEKLAIVGLNGAGKTTLIKLLCGLLDPTEGRVLLNGQDIRQFNRTEYYKLFCAVFQDFSVMECSAVINVAQCLEGIDLERVKECVELAGLTQKLNSLPQGLDTPIGRRVYEEGVELSGGEMQRLMLARALYKNGPILVLDEPTAALDPIAEDDIYQKYNNMSQGKTCIFISHRLASTRFCDRILFLKDGAICEEGTHDRLLMQKGGYAELFDVQAKYYQEGSAAE